jgi:capsular polysaccharide biosynthesis protein
METKVRPRRRLRWWWLVVAGIVVALGAWILVSRGPDGYEASTRLVVGPEVGDTDTMHAAGSLARTYAEVAESKALLADAARSLGVGADEVEMDATANEETRVLVISVRNDDAKRAAALAKALSEALVLRITEQPGGPEGTITILEPAAIPKGD